MVKGEPSLQEILNEPIVQMLMAADRVSLDELLALLDQLHEPRDEG